MVYSKTFTLDRMILESSISGTPTKCSPTMYSIKRGFHIFETETLQKTEVNNPYRMFYNIYFEDSDYQLLDTSELSDKIVKVIVRKKTDVQKFEKFIDKIFSAGPALK